MGTWRSPPLLLLALLLLLAALAAPVPACAPSLRPLRGLRGPHLPGQGPHLALDARYGGRLGRPRDAFANGLGGQEGVLMFCARAVMFALPRCFDATKDWLDTKGR